MSVWKKGLSTTRRIKVSRPLLRERISEATNSRRPSVERATQSPPGSLYREGVSKGGVEDVDVSHIARTTSGVSVRGVNRLQIAKSRRAATSVGRVRSQPKPGKKKAI